MRPLLTSITLLLAISFAQPTLSFGQCSGGYTDSIDSLTIYITNQATGAYDVIEYDFGDGSYVTGVPNPVHTYSQEGFYEVCQIVYDTTSFICFDFQCDTFIFGNATCMANFWWFPDGLDVEYYNASLGAYDSLSWDFGDGSYSNDTMPIHSFSSPGTYTTCLSLFDSAGSMCDSACFQVYVDSSSCEADFSYSANGLTVGFTNQSSGNYNSQFWDFGDGFGTSNQANPSYTYFVAGSYQVCLTIFDTLTWTCYDEVCIDVTVTSGGGGGCEASYYYETSELTIECTNTSTGNILTSIWDYGDGSTPTVDESHTFDGPGTYDVCLTVGNIIPFCLDQYCESVTVYDFNCVPSFNFSFDTSTNVFSFQNTTTSPNVTSILWEFGDGNTSTFANPSYTYNVPGTYEVCLNTYDESNLCGIACKEVNVYPLGVREAADLDIKIFPNPSDGNFLLERGNALGTIQIILRDLQGRELSRQLSNKRFIALHYDVPAGAYLLQLTDEAGVELVKRVVVQ